MHELCYLVTCFIFNLPVGQALPKSIYLKYNYSHSENKYLEKLATSIGEKYFTRNRCLNVLREEGLLSNFKLNNTIILLEVDSERDDCPDILYSFFRKTFEHKCDGYIVQFHNPRCAIQGWFDTYKQRFVPRHNPKYFFLPIFPEGSAYVDDLMSMRQTDLSSNILAGEINKTEHDWSVVLWTNNFYEHPTKPGRIKKLYLDEWHYQKGFKENADLYPDKVLDLHGKPFRIATGKYQPFTSADPLDGFENRIAIQFCEICNCSPVAVEDDFLWGTFYDNYTGDGTLGNVYGDSADIGNMAVYLWLDPSYFVDYTASYLRGDVTLMLPRPTRVGGWIIPFLPFKFDMWIAFFLSLFVSALSLYTLTKASIKYTRFHDMLIWKTQFTTIEDSSMRAIGLAVLQQPSSRLIGDSPNRYLFTSFEFLYLVLSAMYSAELASFLTVPLYNPPIDNIHEFAKSGLLWLGTHEAWSYALKESPDKEAKIVVQHFRVLPMDELMEKAKEGKYGFTAERLTGGSITEQDHVTEEVIPMYHIMKEPLFGSPLVSCIKKAGPYNEHFDIIVNKIVEHGLSLFWEAEVSRLYLNSRIQAEYKEAKAIRTDSSPATIELAHIQGILYLYAIGIISGVFIFLYELWKGNDKNKGVIEPLHKNKSNLQLEWDFMKNKLF